MGEKTLRGGPKVRRPSGRMLGFEGWGPEPRKMGPAGWGPAGWGLEGWEAQNLALFFSPATIFFHSSLSWGLLVDPEKWVPEGWGSEG